MIEPLVVHFLPIGCLLVVHSKLYDICEHIVSSIFFSHHVDTMFLCFLFIAVAYLVNTPFTLTLFTCYNINIIDIQCQSWSNYENETPQVTLVNRIV